MTDPRIRRWACPQCGRRAAKDKSVTATYCAPCGVWREPVAEKIEIVEVASPDRKVLWIDGYAIPVDGDPADRN